MIKKKGISTVIATVLIILITVAAVTIVWAVVIPLITEKSGTGLTCEEARTDIEIVSAKCVGEIPCEHGMDIQIKRGSAGVDIEDVKVLFYDDNGLKGSILLSSWDADNTNIDEIGKSQVVTYSIDPVQSLYGTKEVTIAPIVEGEECDALITKVQAE